MLKQRVVTETVTVGSEAASVFHRGQLAVTGASQLYNTAIQSHFPVLCWLLNILSSQLFSCCSWQILKPNLPHPSPVVQEVLSYFLKILKVSIKEVISLFSYISNIVNAQNQLNGLLQSSLLYYIIRALLMH